jgi:hypothetical protein
MSRLFLMLTAGVFLALPPLFASGADPQGNQDDSWKSLYSVVSHRGVRVNMAQPPPAPAPEAPTLEAPAPEDPAPEPEAAEPDAPELTEPVSPAPDSDALEAPEEEESPQVPADEESESPGDETTAPPLLAPESCGPVRARITDLAPPDAVPVPDDISPLPQKPPAQTNSVVSSPAPCGSSACAGSCGHAGGCRLRGRGGRGGRGGSGGAMGGENPWCFCQMPQHLSYFPEMHGYYYFRSYNWTHIAEHQRIASEWGEDPRNPYGRQLFEQVYADYLAEKDAEMEPLVDPLVEPEDAVVPLPLEGN